jgi:hypothetical protein
MGAPESGGELKAQVSLTRHEFAHLWSGGVLALKLATRGMEVALELTYQEAPPTRGQRFLLKRVDLD